MAKDKNKQATTSAKTSTEITPENVVEERAKRIISNDDLTKDVLDTIKKEQDERTKSAIKSRCLNANYKADMAKMKLRRRRREDDVAKKMLVKYSDLKDGMMGFDVDDAFMQHHSIKGDEGDLKMCGKDIHVKKGDHMAPFIDYTDFDEMKRELEREESKLYDEVSKLCDKETKKIKAAYGDYWSWDW